MSNKTQITISEDQLEIIKAIGGFEKTATAEETVTTLINAYFENLYTRGQIKK